MRIGLLARPEDVEHGKAIYRQAVGDEAPMAAPPGQLSAHDRAGSQPSELLERLDAAFEVRGQHVIGIAAKAGVLPCAIGGVRSRLAPSGEQRLVQVLQSAFG